MTKIIWQTKTIKYSELVFNSKNPRLITDEASKDLKNSLQKFSLVEIPVINFDNMIISGHQRVRTIFDTFPNYEGDVRYPDRQLNEDEVQELMLKLNTHNGDFDWVKISNNFNLPKLKGFGLGKKFWDDFKINNLTEVKEVNEQQINNSEFICLVNFESEFELREFYEKYQNIYKLKIIK